ncbi:MAG TPA: ATPase domain-containing protein [Bacteroidales bacterium]|nr:ATPase domain-containing protein [Bacteroidales bacterium]
MLGHKGFYKGSSILLSGTAGTGKSSLSAQFTYSACNRKEKVLYFSLEESPNQILRNMQSIGIDLEPYLKNRVLKFYAVRPTMTGLEMHLANMHKEINKFNPDIIIVDPLNSFVTGSNQNEAKAMSMRLIDFLKIKNITGFFTYLTRTTEDTEHNFISSLIDTWILLRDIEISGERNRGLYILKSRGMNHSNQIREFLITDKGLKLLDVYSGIDGVLTGSSRIAQEIKNQEEQINLQNEVEYRKRSLEQKRRAMKARIEAIEAEFASLEEEDQKMIKLETEKISRIRNDQKNMMDRRKGQGNNKFKNSK